MKKKFEVMTEHFGVAESAKSEVLKRWISTEDVQKVLHHHAISPAFFAKYFGSKVIDFAVGVIRGQNRLGNCPVIGVMLVFFEKKNIPLGDVFTICVNLKNALIDYSIEKEVLDHDLFHEICALIDHNFLGVIEEYLDLHYNPALTHGTCDLEVRPADSTATFCTAMTVPSAGHSSTTAVSYAKEVEIDYETLEELAELEEDALLSLDLVSGISEPVCREVVELFERYAKIIDGLVEFQELSYALRVLVDLLKKIDLADMGEELTYVAIYIKAIISDLSMWRVSVFIDKNADDIHYLDKTLLSSITQLQIMLSPQTDAHTDEVEFF